MALPPVSIRFTTAGLPEIDRAFATIEQRMVRLEKEATRAGEAGSKTRVRLAKEEAADKERVAAEGAKATSRIEQGAAREKERLDKYLEGVRRRSSEAAGRLAESQAREETRAAERAAREVERLEEYKMRVRIRSSEMAGRAAEAEARAEERAHARVSRALGASATRSLGRTIGGAASLAGGALAIGGGFALADIAGRELGAERTAALLVNAVTTGKAPPAGANVGAILGQASQIARETGMSKEELIGGTLEYSRKARGGDFAGAMANMGFFARMAKVTGTDINDIAAAAGTLQSQNPNLHAPEMQQMLLDVYAQGKAGSMSMVDVAKQVGILSSARSSFAGNAADNQRKLLALGQLAAPEGTVEEAGTFIKNMAAEAGAHRASTKGEVGLEAMGVRFNKLGQMESPEQMIESVFRGTGGDITKIEKIFGLRGTALFRALQPAFAAAGGGEAGIKAVGERMAGVTGATMTTEDLGRQFEQTMSTPAERLHKTLNELSEVVAMRLEPVLGKLADMLEQNGPAIEHFMTSLIDLGDWLVRNPWTGLGLAVTGAVTKDIASAAIGQGIRSVLSTSLASSLTGGLAVAAATIAIGAAVIDLVAHHDVEHQRNKLASEITDTNTIGDVRNKVRTGRVTPADVAKLNEEIAQQEAALKKEQEGGKIYGGLPMLGGSGVNFTALLQRLGLDEAGAARHKSELENTTRTLGDLRREAAEAAKALANAAAATAANTSSDNPARHAPIDKRPP